MASKSLAQQILDKYMGTIERVDLCALLGISNSHLTLLIDGKRAPSATLRDKMIRLLDDPKGLLKEWTRDMDRKLVNS